MVYNAVFCPDHCKQSVHPIYIAIETSSKDRK